jgi:hypothetical protein
MKIFISQIQNTEMYAVSSSEQTIFGSIHVSGKNDAIDEAQSFSLAVEALTNKKPEIVFV